VAPRTQRSLTRQLRRLHLLPEVAEARADDAITEALHTSRSTVERTRPRCVQAGTTRALRDRPRPGAPRKLDGKREALLLALARSAPPEGQARWGMRVLADRLVTVGVVGAPLGEIVRRVLEPCVEEQWCIPRVGAEFVWHLEDGPDLYAEPYDPSRPGVCFDERPCQLVADVRPLEVAQPGRPRPRRLRASSPRDVQRVHRLPATGRLASDRRDRPTRLRRPAERMRRLVDEHVPAAETIRVVLDNLRTHTPAALGKLQPGEAAAIARAGLADRALKHRLGADAWPGAARVPAGRQSTAPPYPPAGHGPSAAPRRPI
jgi:transposase